MGRSRSSVSRVCELFGRVASSLRSCIFRILSVGPIPNHVAFILDGNRRYARKNNLDEGAGHRAGYLALMSLLKYCYELRIKYVTVYAFSIDNFRRRPKEIKFLMALFLEKIEGLLKEESIVNRYGVRVYFLGNLKLLYDPVRLAAEELMRATANNSQCVLSVCVAYTSCDEIVHAIQQSCRQLEDDETKSSTFNYELAQERTSSNCIAESKMQQQGRMIKVVDIEKQMYLSIAPDPDLLIRSSGETRLSNFLLWQTSHCQLYSPNALWPEMGLRYLVWAILNFQRTHSYLDNKRKAAPPFN